MIEWPLHDLVKWLKSTWHAKVTIIQAYAPTNVSTDDGKLEFYNHLQEKLDEIPCHDIKILINDFNTQINSNREGRECTIVWHNLGNTISDNGGLLIQFCSCNRLCIGNSLC